METGDFIVAGTPLVIPANSPAQTFEVDFALAAILQGPAGGGGWFGPLYAGARLYSEHTASGVTFKARNITLRVAKIEAGGVTLSSGKVAAGKAPGAIVRGRRVRA